MKLCRTFVEFLSTYTCVNAEQGFHDFSHKLPLETNSDLPTQPDKIKYTLFQGRGGGGGWGPGVCHFRFCEFWVVFSAGPDDFGRSGHQSA